jgi:hypothetical protein
MVPQRRQQHSLYWSALLASNCFLYDKRLRVYAHALCLCIIEDVIRQRLFDVRTLFHIECTERQIC